MFINSVSHNDPNNAQHNALHQVGHVHNACALRAHCAQVARSLRVVARVAELWECNVTAHWACAKSQHPNSQLMSRHPESGRDPKRPTYVAIPIPPNNVATSKRCRDTTLAHNGAFRSRHYKLCRDTPVTPLCRDTKTVPLQTSAHTQLSCRDAKGRVVTPKQMPLSRHEKSCHDPEPACPSPAMSRPWAK